MTQCPNCGARQRRPNARFCQNCGYSLAAVNAQPQRAGRSPRSVWLWLGAGLLVLLLIGAAIFAFGPGQVIPGRSRQHPQTRVPATPTPSSTPSHTPASPTAVADSPTATPAATETATPPPTATPLPPPTRIPPTATPAPTRPAAASNEELVRAVLANYRDIKVESLTYWNTQRLDEALTYPVLERQRRGICGMKKEGKYFQYSNREFLIQSISFPDSRHATVLARIRENRILKKVDGRTLKDYGHEDYRAVFQLKKEADGQWKIYCYQALDDDEPVSCKITIPKEDPCRSQ